MDHVETDGDTIDQAIENALKVLGFSRDKITVDIQSEGKRGILGFGAQKARIRASLTKAVRPAEIAEPKRTSTDAVTPVDNIALTEKAKSVLSDILALMGVQGAIETTH